VSGYLFVSVNSPKGITIEWIINADLTKNALLAKVAQLKWMQGEPAIFIAAESSQMMSIKALVKSKPGYLKQQTYASGYWKK
jgi:NADPH-dependent ferric siderophore reductase